MQIYEQNEKMLEQQMLPFGLMSTGDDAHDEEVNESLFDGGPKNDFWVAQKRGFFEGNFWYEIKYTIASNTLIYWSYK